MVNIEKDDEIEIVQMVDEPHYNGRIGKVLFIDSIGQLHGTWGGLAVIPEQDEIKIIKKKGQ